MYWSINKIFDSVWANGETISKHIFTSLKDLGFKSLTMQYLITNHAF